MYDEREQDGFGIGDALASLALILGGGAAGRKMAGKKAIPSKKELADLMAAVKASGSRAINTPIATHAAAAKQRAGSLYEQALQKMGHERPGMKTTVTLDPNDIINVGFPAPGAPRMNPQPPRYAPKNMFRSDLFSEPF